MRSVRSAPTLIPSIRRCGRQASMTYRFLCLFYCVFFPLRSDPRFTNEVNIEVDVISLSAI